MFQEIANHLWQSTLFVLCIAALCRFLRGDSARIRYWLWWAASVKFLVPFSLLTAIGKRFADVAAVAPVPEAWTDSITVIARPFAAAGQAWPTGNLLLVVWAAGALVVLGRWVWRDAGLRRVLANAAPDPKPLFDGRRRIAVLRTAARIEPGVVGLLRPSLLLPAGLEARLQRPQFESVVAHELCHIRRRDNLTAAVHMAVEALFWFHPLIWWVGARLIDERERACDEMVVALGHDRETYAESILDVCAHYVATPLCCAAGISGSDLKQRITQIMRGQRMHRLKPTKQILLAIAALLSIAVPLLAGLAVQQPANAQEGEQQAQSPPVQPQSQPPAQPRSQPEAQPPTQPPSQPPSQQPPSQSPPGSTSPATTAPDPEDMLPITRVPPHYPTGALSNKIEGWVRVQFTITTTGSVANAIVVASEPDDIFDEVALTAIRQWRYNPPMVNDVAVERAGVQTMIRFELTE